VPWYLRWQKVPIVKAKVGRLGVCEYAREKGAYSYSLPDQVKSNIKKQREESIASQKREIEKYAEDNNILVKHWYTDEGFSGTTNNRPDFKRMLADSYKHDFTIVLVYKLDRFSRDKLGNAIAKEELRKNGVAVVSVIERIENNPEGKLSESIFEIMSEYYVRNLARGTLNGMKENILNGLSIGPCTYGYKLTPKLDEHGNQVKKICHGKYKVIKVYTTDPRNAEAVKLIFSMFLSGANRNQILARLKMLGYKNAKGKDFQPTNIDRILRNERYTGVYIMKCNQGKMVNYKPIEILRNENGLPKIIEKEDFDQVQQILDARKHRPNSHSAVNYLLTGKMFCGECGAPFTGSTHSKKGHLYYYYRCGRNNENCKIVSIRKEAIEDFVIEKIKNIISSEKYTHNIIDRFIEYYQEKNNNSEIIKDLEKELREIERQISNITDVVANTGKFLDTFETKLDALSQRKQEILAILKKESDIGITQTISKDMVRQSYLRVIKLLQNGEIEDKRSIIDMVLNRVVVYKDRIETFVNILPYEGNNAEMSITSEDLSTYGLLEAAENENIASQGEIPTDNCLGVPGGNRTLI
ncbi:MAG: recombinase family protein, partial [Clostridia bacterium]|nr:recombinase family protein [Clostridia bacterium]